MLPPRMMQLYTELFKSLSLAFATDASALQESYQIFFLSDTVSGWELYEDPDEVQSELTGVIMKLYVMPTTHNVQSLRLTLVCNCLKATPLCYVCDETDWWGNTRKSGLDLICWCHHFQLFCSISTSFSSMGNFSFFSLFSVSAAVFQKEIKLGGISSHLKKMTPSYVTLPLSLSWEFISSPPRQVLQLGNAHTLTHARTHTQIYTYSADICHSHESSN